MKANEVGMRTQITLNEYECNELLKAWEEHRSEKIRRDTDTIYDLNISRHLYRAKYRLQDRRNERNKNLKD